MGVRATAFSGTPEQAAAERFLGAAFPAGVQAITALPYIDQVAAVEALLEQLRGALAEDVTALGLDGLVTRPPRARAPMNMSAPRGWRRLEVSQRARARRRSTTRERRVS